MIPAAASTGESLYNPRSFMGSNLKQHRDICRKKHSAESTDQQDFLFILDAAGLQSDDVSG